MRKFRNIVVIIAIIVYLVLYIAKADIPEPLFILLLGIVMANQAFENWNEYLKTKKKSYLFIPIGTFVVLSFIIFKQLFELI